MVLRIPTFRLTLLFGEVPELVGIVVIEKIDRGFALFVSLGKDLFEHRLVHERRQLEVWDWIDFWCGRGAVS